MLEIRAAFDGDVVKIRELLQESRLNLNSLDKIILNSMIAYDGEEAVAAAGFSVDGNSAVIQYVVVRKRRQKEYLGDGILKALLNFADKKGIKRVYVKGTAIPHFFQSVGFEEVSYENIMEAEPDSVINHFSKEDSIFTAKLPDFFLKACRSNKS